MPVAGLAYFKVRVRNTRLLGAALVLGATACGGGPTQPATLHDSYILIQANGQDLPLRQFALLSGGGGCTLDLQEASMHFDESNQYIASFQYYRDCPGSAEDGLGYTTSRGSFAVNGQRVELTTFGDSMIDLVEAEMDGSELEVLAFWTDDIELLLRFDIES